MNSPKTYLVVLLACTTVGGALLAWRQYGELVDLRAASLNRDERADLQKRIWDLEKSNRELRDQLAAQRGPGAREGAVADADGERPARGERGGRGGDRGPGGRGDAFQRQSAAVRDLMSKPEVQAMLSLQQKMAIEGRYATLFKNLNLPPDQIEKLKSLLAERGTTLQDVFTAGRDLGIDPRQNPEGFRKLVADSQDEINRSIKAVIGEQGFTQLSTYEQTLPQRNLVNDLQQRLSYTSAPLTSAQTEQLVQILAANTPPRTPSAPTDGPGRGGPPPGGGGFPTRGPDVGAVLGAIGGPGASIMVGGFDGGRGPGGAVVTAAAVTQAQSVLAPSQLAALQQIQQQQEAQQQLRKLVSETVQATQPTAPATGAPAPATRKGGG